MTKSRQWISYNFAVLRVVPHVHTGVFAPVGVVLHARTAEFIGVRVITDAETLSSRAGDADVAAWVAKACEKVKRLDPEGAARFTQCR
jgi:hypothetical protein